MPLEFQRRGIHEDFTGYILGIFSITGIFGSPFMSIIIQRFGRIKTLSVSCLGMFFSIASFGVITRLESNTWFIVISFFTRFLQGTASIGIAVTIFTVAGNFYT